MVRALVLAAALALSAAGANATPTLDAKGKCRDAGKFVKAEMCKPAPAAKCRDVKTKKFAKCGAPGTEAIPAKK